MACRRSSAAPNVVDTGVAHALKVSFATSYCRAFGERGAGAHRRGSGMGGSQVGDCGVDCARREHQPFQQAVARQPVGAVQPRARHLRPRGATVRQAAIPARVCQHHEAQMSAPAPIAAFRLLPCNLRDESELWCRGSLEHMLHVRPIDVSTVM